MRKGIKCLECLTNGKCSVSVMVLDPKEGSETLQLYLGKQGPEKMRKLGTVATLVVPANQETKSGEL